MKIHYYSAALYNCTVSELKRRLSLITSITNGSIHIHFSFGPKGHRQQSYHHNQQKNEGLDRVGVEVELAWSGSIIVQCGIGIDGWIRVCSLDQEYHVVKVTGPMYYNLKF